MLTTGFIKSSAWWENTEPDWPAFNTTYASTSVHHAIQNIISCRLSAENNSIYTCSRQDHSEWDPRSWSLAHLHCKHTPQSSESSHFCLNTSASHISISSHFTFNTASSGPLIITLIQFWHGLHRRLKKHSYFHCHMHHLSWYPAAVHARKALDPVQAAVSCKVFKLLSLLSHLILSSSTATHNALLPPTTFYFLWWKVFKDQSCTAMWNPMFLFQATRPIWKQKLHHIILFSLVVESLCCLLFTSFSTGFLSCTNTLFYFLYLLSICSVLNSRLSRQSSVCKHTLNFSYCLVS